MSESIRNASFNLERLSRFSRLARPGIATLERFWKGFDLDAVFFMRTLRILKAAWRK